MDYHLCVNDFMLHSYDYKLRIRSLEIIQKESKHHRVAKSFKPHYYYGYYIKLIIVIHLYDEVDDTLSPRLHNLNHFYTISTYTVGLFLVNFFPCLSLNDVTNFCYATHIRTLILVISFHLYSFIFITVTISLMGMAGWPPDDVKVNKLVSYIRLWSK